MLLLHWKTEKIALLRAQSVQFQIPVSIEMFPPFFRHPGASIIPKCSHQNLRHHAPLCTPIPYGYDLRSRWFFDPRNRRKIHFLVRIMREIAFSGARRAPEKISPKSRNFSEEGGWGGGPANLNLRIDEPRILKI